MSFGGARSGEKGAHGKKVKKPKRDFHTARRRPAKTVVVDKQAAKDRALEGLAHLGQQRFSTGPSGYDLKSWLRSLNLLLDDFEAKMKGEGLPTEYFQKREEVASRFSSGVDTSAIESEVDSIRSEETEIRTNLDRERERITSRLVELRAEREGNGKTIEEQKAALEQIKERRKSASFLSRLAGRAGPPTEPVEQKIAELEKAAAALEKEAQDLQRDLASVDKEGGKPAGAYERQWTRVEAIESRLKELEAEMQEKSELAKERESATAELAEVISKSKRANAK